MNGIDVRIVAICAVSAALCARGDVLTNTWISGSTDWSAAASYAENRVPNAGDAVVIPSGVTATVSVVSTEVANTEGSSFDVFSKLGRVLTEDATSAIVLDISDGVSVTNGCLIYGKNAGQGTIIKRGLGVIELGATTSTGYNLDVLVEEGALVAPQELAKSTTLYIMKLTVNEGASFITAMNAGRTSGLSDSSTQCTEIWGNGAISNRYNLSQRLDFRANGRSFTFGGTIGRGIRIFPHARVNMMLTGSGSTFGGAVEVNSRATIGFVKMGTKSDAASSIGSADEMRWRGDSGTFIYLGEGETSDKDIVMHSLVDVEHVLDGGATGNLRLTGTLGYNTAAKADTIGMKRVTITGSNTVPCVIAGAISGLSYNGTNYYYHITKKGTGTWRLSSSARTHPNAWTVEEGTLQFDTLYDKGKACSLGLSTNLFESYSGLIDESKRVDWAFALGSAKAEGVFEYTGTNGVMCETRHILLKGDGRLSVTNKLSRFRFANVSAAAGKTVTFTLDGANTNECSIVNVHDGDGTLSLAKEGKGTWYLEGSNTFSGSLSVKEGTLVVRNPTNYSWYCWTLQECNPDVTATDNYIQAGEFGLYAANGYRVNGGLKQVEGQTAYHNIEPGMAAYHKYGTIGGFGTVKRPLQNLFDDGTNPSPAEPGNGWTFCWYTGSTQNARPSLDNPDTWVPVMMRLTNGAARVASFDVVSQGKADAYRNYSAFTLEGSVDGVNWHYVTNFTGVGKSGQGKWEFAKTSYTAGAFNPEVANGGEYHTGGCPIEGGPKTVRSPIADVSSVSVAEGAILKTEDEVTIRDLTVDANGAGTIDGFEFASGDECTLNVENLPADGATLPGTYLNCTGFGNIAGWSLTLGGESTRKKRILIDGGAIRIVPVGMVFTLR